MFQINTGILPVCFLIKKMIFVTTENRNIISFIKLNFV
jgi:hypothetical protein